MSSEALRSANPSRAVRALLVAEVLGYVAVLFAYVWWIRPGLRPARPFDVAFAVFAFAFPVAMNLLHGTGPRDAGFRLDNLAAAARRALLPTLVMCVAVVVAGLLVGSFRPYLKGTARIVVLYPLWGVVQQLVVNAFMLRRLRQAGLPAAAAVVVTAVLFASFHVPNWPLVVLTLGAGLVWSSLYVREPNLFVLGLAHGIVAVLTRQAWPDFWPQGFAVGPRALERMGG